MRRPIGSEGRWPSKHRQRQRPPLLVAAIQTLPKTDASRRRDLLANQMQKVVGRALLQAARLDPKPRLSPSIGGALRIGRRTASCWVRPLPVARPARATDGEPRDAGAKPAWAVAFEVATASSISWHLTRPVNSVRTPTHRPWRRQAGAATTPEACWAAACWAPTSGTPSSAARPSSAPDGGWRSAQVRRRGNAGVCGRQTRAPGPRARSMRSIKCSPRVLDAAAGGAAALVRTGRACVIWGLV